MNEQTAETPTWRNKMMTWNEFKAEVDARLAELNEDGSVEIWFIDTVSPTKEDIMVWVESNKLRVT